MGYVCAGRKLLFWMLLSGSLLSPAACTSDRSSSAATTRPGLQSPAVRGLPNFARVSAHLYRGAQPTREGFIELKGLGIKTVVSLRQDDTDSVGLRGLGMNYVSLPCSGWSVGSRQVTDFLKVLADPANRPVFVHCRQGVDRTGCAVAAYRIVEEGWSADDAIHEMRDFGFHGIFAGIPRYLRRIDAARLRENVTRAASPRLAVFN